MVVKIFKNLHIYKTNQVKDIVLMKKLVRIKNMPLIISRLGRLKSDKDPALAMQIGKIMVLEILKTVLRNQKKLFK